jgi:cell division protein FtsZ
MSDHDASLLPELPELRLKVIGVGGAGNNAVDRLRMDQRLAVPLANLNTDQRVLAASPVAEKVLLGRRTTGGLSAGYDMEKGRAAAEESLAELETVLADADLVFLVAGLGGGTGSGAAPVVAELAVEMGAVVIAFVTLPFSREGARSVKRAEDALRELRTHCHAVIPLPNDLLLQEIPAEATLLDAFQLADDWIGRGVEAIWSMLTRDGLINVDFATLREAFASRGGKTLFGLGQGTGNNAVAEALRQLDLCPLLHLPENRYVRKTDSLIVQVAGGPDLTMTMVNEILDFVGERFGSKDQTVLGAVIDGAKSGSVEITVIGTTAMEGSRRSPLRPPSLVREKRRALEAARVAPVPAGEVAPSCAEPPPRPVTFAQAEPTPAPVADFPETSPRETGRGDAEGLGNGRRRAGRDDQGEFFFPSLDENRGYFERTAENLYEGADLDVPTYLRRGLKISLN